MKIFKSKQYLNKLLPLFLLLAGLLLSFSCAETVTSRLIPVEDINIKFKLRASSVVGVNTDLFDYYLIFSNSGKPQLPAKLTYFTAPGQNADPDKLDQTGMSMQNYYEKYFSTWSDYIVVKDVPPAASLYNGPFSPTSNIDNHASYTPKPYFLSYNLINSSPISLEFSLNFLTPGSTLYISLVTVYKEQDIILDILDIEAIAIEKSNWKTGEGITDYGTLPAQADFVYWEVKIF